MKKEKKEIFEAQNIFGLNDDFIRGYLKNLSSYDDTISREEFFTILKILGLAHHQTAILAAMGKNYNSFDQLKKKVKKAQESSAREKNKARAESIKETQEEDGDNEDITLDIGEAYSFKNILRGLAMEALRSSIQKHLIKAFEKVPSEVICIWIYSKKRIPYETSETKDIFVQQCVLIDGTMLNFDEKSLSPKFVSYRDDIRKFHKHQTSLISFPLSKNTIVRRTGCDIIKHPFKRFKDHRNADYMQKGKMHSLMRVPLVCDDHISDVNEYRRYFFISFENKLNPERTAILETDDAMQSVNFFTAEDEKIALELRKELFLEIFPWLVIAFHDDVPMKKYIELFGKSQKIEEDIPLEMRIVSPHPDNIGNLESNDHNTTSPE